MNNHVLTQVTLLTLPEIKEIALTALRALTTAINTIKDQRKNGHGNMVTKGCRIHSQGKCVDSQIFIIEVIINKHGEKYFKDESKHGNDYLRTDLMRSQPAEQHPG